MTRRRWLVLSIGVALAAPAVVWLGVVTVQHCSEGELSYSVIPSKGHLEFAVSDNRSGEHTVWAVLLEPPEYSERQVMATWRDGSEGGTQSVTNEAALPAGTYSYALYEADGIIYTGGSRFWTPKHLITERRVIVP